MAKTHSEGPPKRASTTSTTHRNAGTTPAADASVTPGADDPLAIARTLPDECTPRGYMDAGFAVFPLMYRSKEPATEHGFHDATTVYKDADWKGDYNVGLPMSRNGLVAIDVDDADAAAEVVSIIERYPTAIQRTSKGFHAFYSTPEALSNGHSLGAGIDVRGVGYVATEPSVHENGFRYKHESKEIAPLPDELRVHLRVAGESATPATSAQVEEFFQAHTLTTEDGEFHLLDRVQWAQHLLDAGTGRNQTTIKVLPNIFRDARAGLYPAQDGLSRLQKLIVGEYRLPEGEFEGIVPRAVGMALADDDDIFEATPILRQIQQAAHSRTASAPALLAYVLGRVLADVPPGITLPPVVGGAASLNFAVAAVGRSGDGKSTGLEVSRELFGMVGAMQADIERNIGSGEGLAQTFLRYNKKTRENELIPHPHRIIILDEIDQLGATQNRNGATISPTLRTALTGGQLGQENAKRENTRRVPAREYRLVMVVGVQQTRSDTLLGQSDAGTPQRFLWVRTTDPTAPDETVAWPGPLDWNMPDLSGVDYIDYPDDVKAEVRAVRLVQLRGGGDPNDGHRMLTRLKVGAALALLHGETFITHQWWELAGRLVDASMRVQGECRAILAQETEKQRRNQGRQDGIRQAGAAEFRNERVTKAAEAIARKVRRHMEGTNEQKHAPSDGCTGRCLSKAVQNFHDIKGSPELKDAALRHAEDAEWIQKRGEDRWVSGPSQPA